MVQTLFVELVKSVIDKWPKLNLLFSNGMWTLGGVFLENQSKKI